MIYFETEGLVFRSWKEEDLIDFQMINMDSMVMQYFPKKLSKQETSDFYERIQEEFRTSGYGLFAVETKCSGEFIGFIGFHKASFSADFTPCVEIGWRLKSEAWGNGYATEGARACLDYGFTKLGFDRVYSFTAKINLRSENVMKKIGMKKLKEFRHPNIDKDNLLSQHLLYCRNAHD